MVLETGLMELIAPAELTQVAVQTEARQEEHQTKDGANTRHHFVVRFIFQDLGGLREGVWSYTSARHPGSYSPILPHVCTEQGGAVAEVASGGQTSKDKELPLSSHSCPTKGCPCFLCFLQV